MAKTITPMTKEIFLDVMEKNGYIKILADDSIIIRQKLLTLAVTQTAKVKTFEKPEEDEDTFWKEFRETYPKRDGNRPLHNNIAACKKKYAEVVGDDESLHVEIIKSIKAEIQDRIEAGWVKDFRPHWKLLSTYINQKGWELYEDHDAPDESKNINDDYGSKLI
jgi:hypothetical protein